MVIITVVGTTMKYMEFLYKNLGELIFGEQKTHAKPETPYYM